MVQMRCIDKDGPSIDRVGTVFWFFFLFHRIVHHDVGSLANICNVCTKEKLFARSFSVRRNCNGAIQLVMVLHSLYDLRLTLIRHKYFSSFLPVSDFAKKGNVYCIYVTKVTLTFCCRKEKRRGAFKRKLDICQKRDRIFCLPNLILRRR